MGKVYNAPKEFELPKFDFRNLKASREAEEAYVNSIREWAKKNSKDELAGETIYIPHADGKAAYVVFSTKPVKLIHLPIGDAWDAPLAHRMTGKDIKEHVARDKYWAEFVKNKRNENKS